MERWKTLPWMHQVEALDYLSTRPAAALFLGMGTGKTKIGIDLIFRLRVPLTLIVGTKKACAVWEREFVKHASGPYEFVQLEGLAMVKKAAALDAVTVGEVPVVMMVNYDSVWRKPFADKLLGMPIGCVICDESHRIKSPGSKCSLYLARLGRHVPRRYIFTGTPSTEAPLDVYAQYRFLDPSIFGTRFDQFRDEYENLDVSRTAFAGYRVLKKNQPYKNLDKLRDKMFSIAYHTQAHLDLPPVRDVVLQFTPNKTACAAYRMLAKDGVFELDGGLTEISNALTKLLRLQEVLSGYLSVELSDFTTREKRVIDNSRAELLASTLEEIGQRERVVIFAKFRHDFDEIKRICKEQGRRYGEISGQVDNYDKWNDGDVDVLAVQYASGAESIDLTAARFCIYYSLTFSYAQYSQSRKRIHRPGQESPVIYYHFVGAVPRSPGSVDGRIMQALRAKKDLVYYLLKQEEEEE